MGPVEFEVELEGSVILKLWGRTGSTLSSKDVLRNGRRGRGLGVSVCNCIGGNLAVEPCHVLGGSAIC